MKADVDLWLKYECKYQGEFYITAVIAKDDIKYLDFDLPKGLTLKNLKKLCGDEKIFLLMYLSGASKPPIVRNNLRSKRYKLDHHRSIDLYCGKTQVEIRYPFYGTASNAFDNFMVIYPAGRSRGKYNLTADFWLELTKDY